MAETLGLVGALGVFAWALSLLRDRPRFSVTGRAMRIARSKPLWMDGEQDYDPMESGVTAEAIASHEKARLQLASQVHTRRVS